MTICLTGVLTTASALFVMDDEPAYKPLYYAVAAILWPVFTIFALDWELAAFSRCSS